MYINYIRIYTHININTVASSDRWPEARSRRGRHQKPPAVPQPSLETLHGFDAPMFSLLVPSVPHATYLELHAAAIAAATHGSGHGGISGSSLIQ